ncbi:YidC/Oxa1 family membrane protein insertase [Streptococcus danieliae]|uniref:YidC/Oxa1 family membrane protein insertase n=1 Tax=Streptococcus danieliae TaxID=747656 RepID=UPI0026E93D85|nr:YidC/Oxa1 family membrane protein insertase [Streptococcus danieliae]
MKRKKIFSAGLVGLALVTLTACGTSQVTSQSSGLWEKLVYLFAEAINGLSFGGNVGLGIILMTLVLRTVLLPVFQYQTKSSQKMQEIQPALRALQEEYRGRGREGQEELARKTQALYAEQGVRPFAAFIPLFVQLPILLAFYQSLTRVDILQGAHFLWLDLSQPDPYLILPFLAAALTFGASWLSTYALKEKNGLTSSMTYIMPVMIFFLSLSVASGVALYWTISNAYQVGQTLFLNNPFKIVAERQREEDEAKQKVVAERKAIRKAQKKRKKK